MAVLAGPGLGIRGLVYYLILARFSGRLVAVVC